MKSGYRVETFSVSQAVSLAAELRSAAEDADGFTAAARAVSDCLQRTFGGASDAAAVPAVQMYVRATNGTAQLGLPVAGAAGPSPSPAEHRLRGVAETVLQELSGPDAGDGPGVVVRVSRAP